MKRLTHSFITVIEQCIAGELLPFVCQDRTLIQIRFPGLCVVIARLGINVVVVAQDIRGTHNVRHLTGRIVPQGIGSQRELRVHQFHVIVEYRLLVLGVVFPPFGSQYILFVHQGTPIEEISQTIYPVVVQTIGQQRRVTVFQTYIHTHLGNLSHTVIIQMVAIQEQGISLFHPYIPERLERVALVEIIGTVAIHVQAVVTENDISYHHLCV